MRRAKELGMPRPTRVACESSATMASTPTGGQVGHVVRVVPGVVCMADRDPLCQRRATAVT